MLVTQRNNRNHTHMHKYFTLENPIKGKISKKIVSIMILQNFYSAYKPGVKPSYFSEDSTESCQTKCVGFLGSKRPHASTTPNLPHPPMSYTIVYTDPCGNRTATLIVRKSCVKARNKATLLCTNSRHQTLIVWQG